MILAGSVLLVVAYAVAASLAVARGGRRRLWLTGAAALVLIAAAALGLGRYFGVPSYARLLLYMMAFTGPVVVVPTVLLSFSSGPRPTWTGRLPMAALGTGVGFVCGWLLTVVGLGVW